ncbi:MAG TPA: hypothetical protein VFQ90_10585 [Stellaceae bacterium]|jgi:hypothetical protein|nr:hypothetical protein [Stellaceae bacterium]
MNGLMLAFSYTLPYHVMRVAAAAGLRVHVLGAGPARGLGASRCCRGYRETRSCGDPEILLAEIGELIDRQRIDVVLPSDDVSTRMLAALADRLPVRCVPLPDLATFDLLNGKWRSPAAAWRMASGRRRPGCSTMPPGCARRSLKATSACHLP